MTDPQAGSRGQELSAKAADGTLTDDEIEEFADLLFAVLKRTNIPVNRDSMVADIKRRREEREVG